jgi:hypothetical protein
MGDMTAALYLLIPPVTPGCLGHPDQPAPTACGPSAAGF